jgi:hypothetical protein
MSKTSETSEAANLNIARAEFSEHWQGLQSRLSNEVGAAPRKSGWLFLLLAAAAGVALGARRMVSGESRPKLR